MPKYIVVHYEEDPSAVQKFESEVRSAWSTHVSYIRSAIASVFGGYDDINAIAARLDTNAINIGDILSPYYGQAAATSLADHMKQLVAIIVDIMRYVKAGRDTSELDASAMQCIEAIADLLSGLDHIQWPKSAVLGLLQSHVAHTKAQILARSKSLWAEEITDYDAAQVDIMKLADAMSGGIASKFPEKFVKY